MATKIHLPHGQAAVWDKLLKAKTIQDVNAAAQAAIALLDDNQRAIEDFEFPSSGGSSTPYAIAYQRNIDQTISNSTDTLIQFKTQYDVDGNGSTTSPDPDTTMEVAVAGTYVVVGNGIWDPNTNGYRKMEIIANFSPVFEPFPGTEFKSQPASSSFDRHNVTGLYVGVPAGGSFSLNVFQNRGGNLVIFGGVSLAAALIQ